MEKLKFRTPCGPFCTKLQSCDGRGQAPLFRLLPRTDADPHFLLKPNIFFAKEEVSVVMQRLSYPTETVLSNKIIE